MRKLPKWVLLVVLIVSCQPEAVLDTATTVTSTMTTITTQPAPSTTLEIDREPIPVLLVVGDWGSGDANQEDVASGMKAYAEANPVAAILTTGDNFYFDDADGLMASYSWVEDMGIEWWLTWGNHDVEADSRIEAVNGSFGNPPLWTVHKWGAIDVVILDSNQVGNLEQAAFFLAAMAESDRPMIVALHHPPYSCSHHGSTVEIIDQFMSFLDDDVVLVLAGHEHSYQRFEKLDVAFVVTGGGGRSLRPLQDCPDNHPPRLAGAEAFHFVALTQTNDSLDLVAIDVNGVTIDRTSIPLP